MHKEIDILKIFESFQNIVNYSSINEFNPELNKIILPKINDMKFSSLCMNDPSLIYSSPYMPKIKNFIKKIPENNVENSIFNWSPIDLNGEKNKNLRKSPKKEKMKGFSTNDRKINFLKNDSIFITNASSDKSYVNNYNFQSSPSHKGDDSRRINNDNENKSISMIEYF